MLINHQYSFGCGAYVIRNKNKKINKNNYLSVNNCKRFEVLTIVAAMNHSTLAQSQHNLNITLNKNSTILKQGNVNKNPSQPNNRQMQLYNIINNFKSKSYEKNKSLSPQGVVTKSNMK